MGILTKLNSNGSSITFSSIVGGAGQDLVYDIDLDDSNNIFLTGLTTSSDFPTLKAFQSNLNGRSDGFVTKVRSDGSGLDFSTYIGGSSTETFWSISVDSLGDVYFAGKTSSNDLIVVNPIQPAFGGGSEDGILGRLNNNGSLNLITYFGGDNNEIFISSDVDPLGGLYVAGWTNSVDFPTLNAFQSNLNGSNDGVVLKLSDVPPDTTPPSFDPIADLIIEAAEVPTTVTIGTPTVFDDISAAENIILTNNAPTSYPLGTTAVTWTATDEAGNFSQTTQNVTVTVTDNEAPIVTAPADVNTEATGTTTTVSIGTATAMDNVTPSASITLTSDAPAAYPVGPTTVTWTGTDVAGNSSTATQLVMVSDTTPPALTVPDDVSVEATSATTTVAIGTAAANDTVDGALTPTNDAPTAFGVGTTVVNYTVTDTAGNTSTGTQTVTVSDTTAPDVTAPADVSVEATGLTTPVSLGSASANDLVDGNLIPTASNTGPFAVGIHTVTWSATDANGNTGTTTQIVTVSDSTAPTFNFSQLVTELWPPNKKMIRSATLSDISDAVTSNPDVNITVTSNQGNSSDWSVTQNGGTWNFELRADRLGNDTERVYNISVDVADDAGNTETTTATVIVPHDQGQNKGGGKKK
jgi:hypothetical protein